MFGVVALITNMMFLVKISCCATELGILVVKFFFRASAFSLSEFCVVVVQGK